MNRALAVFVLLDAALLVGWAAVLSVRRRGPGPGLAGGLVLLELTVVVQAAVDLLGSPGDAREPVVHLAYLATSVALLPLLLALTHRRGTAPATGVIAVACLALAVVPVRPIATGAASA